MAFKDQIDGAKGDAGALEGLYRQARRAGDEGAFKAVIAACAKEDPEDLLLSAWGYRLDIQSVPVAGSDVRLLGQRERRHWSAAVVGSVVLGLFFMFFAGGRPPVPAPGEAAPLFWIGWGPLTALGLLVYLAVVDRRREHVRRYGTAAIVVVFAGVLTGFIAWGRTDHVAILIALHLPFIAWAVVGGSGTLRYPDAARQFYAFLVKSVETCMTAGIYLVAGYCIHQPGI